MDRLGLILKEMHDNQRINVSELAPSSVSVALVSHIEKSELSQAPEVRKYCLGLKKTIE